MYLCQTSFFQFSGFLLYPDAPLRKWTFSALIKFKFLLISNNKWGWHLTSCTVNNCLWWQWSLLGVMLIQSSAALFLRLNTVDLLVSLLWKSQAKAQMSNQFQAVGRKWSCISMEVWICSKIHPLWLNKISCLFCVWRVWRPLVFYFTLMCDEWQKP